MNRYSGQEDQQLMDLVRQHDERAFTEIYHRYKGVLFVHAFRMLESEEEAKDVIQDLFTVLWQRRQDMVLKGNLSSYLYSAVRNRILDQMARSRTRDRYIHSLEGFLREGEEMTDHLLREKELSQLIEREVALLPEKMRQIFRLSRGSELSHKEIAEKMNLSDKTVKKQISNALIILRKKLDMAFALLLVLLH
ncbi:MAG: RNA polymerase sigma-70 factor [Leadbetterella sp.]|nr:RNA polymerase sigma-70 factor [Leadbetterella sp.]